jgi:hypothetical protein
LHPASSRSCFAGIEVIGSDATAILDQSTQELITDTRSVFVESHTLLV